MERGVETFADGSSFAVAGEDRLRLKYVPSHVRPGVPIIEIVPEHIVPGVAIPEYKVLQWP